MLMTWPAGARFLNDATGRTTASYDPDGRVTTVVTPAGLRLTYTYSSFAATKGFVEQKLRRAA